MVPSFHQIVTLEILTQGLALLGVSKLHPWSTEDVSLHSLPRLMGWSQEKTGSLEIARDKAIKEPLITGIMKIFCVSGFESL